MLHAGTITGAHGIKGWVKLHALTESLDSFLSFDHWYRRSDAAGDHYDEIRFLAGRPQGKGLIAQIEGVTTRTKAEGLRGVDVFVRADELPPLEDGEYYWHELTGMQVWTTHGGKSLLLGRVDHLIDTGANDVLVLAPCEGSIDERSRLLPYTVGQVVLKVDAGQQRIDVDWHPED
jgi:16S rRNA processing protein RimM